MQNIGEKLSHNKRFIAALVLTFVAGLLFGHGWGSIDEYNAIEGFLIDMVEHDRSFEIKDQGFFSIKKVNMSDHAFDILNNATLINPGRR